MTVSATGALHFEYVADGLATERSIGFALRRPADMVVTAGGTVQTLGQHYAILGESPNQRIKPLAPFWPSGTTIAYYRQTARGQDYDIPAGINLRNQSLEDELDRTQLQQQEQDSDIARAVKAPRGETGPVLAANAQLRGKALALSDDGSKIVGVAVLDAVQEATEDAENFAALAGRYANSNTDADIPGAAPGDRGSRYWAAKALLDGASQVALATAQAVAAAQSAAYAGGFEVPLVASQAAGNATIANGRPFRVAKGTTPETFDWFQRDLTGPGSVLISPLATSGALAASSGAAMVGMAGGGTVEQAVPYISVRRFGAVADGVERITGVATAGSTTFTDAGANFTLADVGKSIWIRGAGASGAALLTTIAARVSATQITLAAAASTTVASGANYAYGTDNTTAFNTATSIINAAGGGTLYVPRGFYITRGYIRLRDNVEIIGDGYASRIHNIALSGFAKVVIASGNMGDPTNDTLPANYGKSMFGEPGYDLTASGVGAFEISLVNAGDVANFAVGDIVCIQSFEKWTGLEPRNSFGKYLNQNEIIAINGATIRLRWSLLDAYPSSAGARPTIHKISGTSRNGYDNQPLFMSKNCGAHNLRLTQVTGGGSGWYTLFPSGVNQHYSYIWMDDCSSLVGSNNLSYSSFRRFQGRFEAGLFDFAEWVNNIEVEDWIAHRVGANPLLNKIGGAFNKGSDNHARRIRVDLGGWGRMSAFISHRSSYDDCDIFDSGSAAEQAVQPGLNNEAILLGFGSDVRATNNRIYNQFRHGIALAGEGNVADGNIIPKTNSGSFAIVALASLINYTATNNLLGTEGDYQPQDRVHQLNGIFSPAARIFGNGGYVEDLARRGRRTWAGFATTSATGTPAVLQTVGFKGTTGVSRGFIIEASGVRGGTASTKSVFARLGGTTIAQVNYAAADTGVWKMRIILTVRTSTNALHVDIETSMGLTRQQSNFTSIPNGLVNDVNFTIEGLVANAADSVVIQTLNVLPIEEMVL